MPCIVPVGLLISDIFTGNVRMNKVVNRANFICVLAAESDPRWVFVLCYFFCLGSRHKAKLLLLKLPSVTCFLCELSYYDSNVAVSISSTHQGFS